MVGGGNDDELFGGEGDDRLWGDDVQTTVAANLHGKDYLDGEAGDDQLIGGGDGDDLEGGDGNDYLRGDDSLDNLVVSAHGNDTLSGGAGDDVLLGDSGDDALYGGDGDDVLDGGDGIDMLDGGAGRNSLFGGKGNDILTSAGADYLDGGEGDDTLIVSVADGQSGALIDDGAGVNTLVFNGGFSAADAYRVFGQGNTVAAVLGSSTVVGIGDSVDLTQLRVQVSGTDLGFVAMQDIVLATDAGGRISSGMRTSGGIVSTASATFAFTLTGGTRGDAMNGGTGNDTLDGANGSDRVSGGLGSDILYGGNGADILVGGGGDDTLFGGDRQGLDDGAGDTFVFELGDGVDRIDAASIAYTGAALNVIRFGPGVTAGNIRLSMNDVGDRPGNGDVIIDYSTIDRVVLASGAFGQIAQIAFDDGSSLTHAEVLGLLNAQAANGAGEIKGTSGNDSLVGTAASEKLYGFDGDDVLQGGGGSDLLVGGLGSNTYVFDLSSGSDVIVSTLPSALGAPHELGLLRFTGTQMSDVSAEVDGFDLVLMQAAGSVVRLQGYQSSPALADWHIEDRDGTRLTLGSLLARQNASAPADLDARRAAFLSKQLGQLATLSQRYDPAAGSTGAIGSAAMVVPRSVTTASQQIGVGAAFQHGSYLSLADAVVTTYTSVQEPDYAFITSTRPGTGGAYVSRPQGGGDFALPPGATPVFGPPDPSIAPDALGYLSSLVIGYMLPGGTSTTSSQSQIVGWHSVTTSHATVTTHDTATQAVVTGTTGDDVVTPQLSSVNYPTLFRGAVDTGAGNDMVTLGTGSNTGFAGGWTRFNDWDTEVPSLYGSAYPFQTQASNVNNYPRGLGAWIDAGAGDDRVSGSDGNDFIVGGAGSDWMDGQAGADTYFVSRNGGGVDHISDLAWTEKAYEGPYFTTASMAVQADATRLDEIAVATDASVSRDWSDRKFLTRSDRGVARPPKPLVRVIIQPPVPLGPANEDAVEFDAAILLGSLSYRWNDAPTGTPDPGFADYPLRALELYQNGQHFLDIDYLAGLDSRSYSKAGVEKFRFADGQVLTLDQLLMVIPDRALTVPVLTAAFSDVQALEDAALLVGLASHFTVRGGLDITFSATLANGDALPGFMTLNPVTGALSGMPGNDDVGAYVLLVRARTDAGFVDAAFKLRIDNVNDAPVVVASVADSMDPLPVAAGATFSIVLPTGLFSDVDVGDALTLSATLPDGGSLPAWLAFDSGTRTVSGARPISDTSTAVIAIHATDTAGGSATALVEVSYRDALGKAHINGTPNGDILYGSAGDDNMNGLAGNDVLMGRAGNDALAGGAGDDLLDGGVGADRLVGGTGNDTYVVETTTDVVTERAGEGLDTVNASLSWTLSANVENLNLTGTANIDGTGNTLANQLTGNGGTNRLDGGAGADLMIGAAGDDTYIVNNAGDRVVEAASEGTDLIESTVSFTLITDVENLTLMGTGGIAATGNGLANTLRGNGGANRIDGGAGDDAMIGGLGNDTYVADSLGDTTVENVGEGTDTVEASISWALANDVENLTLTGASAIDAIGNTLSNKLRGNTANNVLDGAAGNDTMIGGAGDDTYRVDVATDMVTELAGEGTDTIESGVTRTLSANVEILKLVGNDAINGTGNTLDNTLFGNSAANTLIGGAGNDTLDGAASADRLIGGTGADIYRFNAGHGIDTIQENDATLSVKDAVQFLGTIKQADVQFKHIGNNLEVLLNGTADKLVIQNWYLGSPYQVEEFRFSDSTVLLNTQVQSLVSAMASFNSPTAGIESSPLHRPMHNHMIGSHMLSPPMTM